MEDHGIARRGRVVPEAVGDLVARGGDVAIGLVGGGGVDDPGAPPVVGQILGGAVTRRRGFEFPVDRREVVVGDAVVVAVVPRDKGGELGILVGSVLD